MGCFISTEVAMAATMPVAVAVADELLSGSFAKMLVLLALTLHVISGVEEYPPH